MNVDSKPSSAPVLFSANLDAVGRPIHGAWQWCVGSGHATLALRSDWQQQLKQARADLGFRHVRFHGILDDSLGTLVGQNEKSLYSFFNIDRIFDFLLSIGMKPVIELSFMPRLLSSGDAIVFRYRSNITPPADFQAWGALIRRLAQHLVERYGIDEVSQWPFECWNEPNLKAFWTADQAAYFKLYDVTAQALKSVEPRLQVGGPVTANNAWLPEFLHHCRESGSAVDFLSTHFYPTDPFGAVDADTITQLQHSPPGIMRSKAVEARESAEKLPLYYTEWSISSNPRDPFHDSSFAAAFAVRIAMSVDDVVDGYSYWTFSDIFEENYFPSMPFHGGFGMQNLYAIPKPIYRALQQLRTLGNRHLEVRGQHDTVAVWIGAGQDATNMLLINQALPRHAIAAESVGLQLTHGRQQRPRAVSVRRIDEDHANPARAWRDMGKPEYLSPEQVRTLTDASQTVAEPLPCQCESGTVEIDLILAPQSVNHLQIEW